MPISADSAPSGTTARLGGVAVPVKKMGRRISELPANGPIPKYCTERNTRCLCGPFCAVGEVGCRVFRQQARTRTGTEQKHRQQEPQANWFPFAIAPNRRPPNYTLALRFSNAAGFTSRGIPAHLGCAMIRSMVWWSADRLHDLPHHLGMEDPMVCETDNVI